MFPRYKLMVGLKCWSHGRSLYTGLLLFCWFEYCILTSIFRRKKRLKKMSRFVSRFGSWSGRLSGSAGQGWTKTCVIPLDTEVRKAEGAAQTPVTTETEDPLCESLPSGHSADQANHTQCAVIRSDLREDRGILSESEKSYDIPYSNKTKICEQILTKMQHHV